MVSRVSFASADTRSFERAVIVLRKVGDIVVSDDTVQRVTVKVGQELAERRDAELGIVVRR
jgi:hypothetical protein